VVDGFVAGGGWFHGLSLYCRVVGDGRRGLMAAMGQAFFSRCPPNSERSADRTFQVNSPASRESNRSYSDAAITDAGTPSSTAASTVHRPSPESDTRPLNSSRSGDLAKAAAVRSTSQELITEPRRHTSATSPMSIVYW